MVLANLPKQKITAHDKKRQGQHHKSSKHYVKTYWPYLPMLLIVGFGFILNSLFTQPGNVLGYATAVSPTTLLEETNLQRTGHNRSALALNNELAKAAQEKANDMAKRNYWSHATPEGSQPWELISSNGYDYAYAGENLAYGFNSGAFTVAGWMNSNSHRNNLLNVNYKDVGFGIANAANYMGTGEQTIIVALYASPKDSTLTLPAATGNTSHTLGSDSEPPAITAAGASQFLSRADVLAPGAAPWLIGGAIVLALLAAITLIYRHGKLWHKYVIRGERFLIKHPLYDIILVAAIVVSIILSRGSGTIH